MSQVSLRFTKTGSHQQTNFPTIVLPILESCPNRVDANICSAHPKPKSHCVIGHSLELEMNLIVCV